MTARECDVVVIGGGPAGSTVSTLLKQYDPNRRVVLFERTRFPRHHIGESTLPEINRILHKMGVLRAIDSAGFVRKRGVTYKWANDKPIFSEVFSEGVLDGLAGTPGHIPDYSWQVDRSRYDHILLDHARSVGVEVIEGAQVVGVLRDGERVSGVDVLRGAEQATFSSRFVVDCSGQARVLSTLLRLEKQAHALGDLAIYRYYRGFQWKPQWVGSLSASRIFFQAARRGWMWFIPLSETDVSVGLVTRKEFLQQTRPEPLFDEELASLPEISAMLEGAVQTEAPGEPGVEPRTRVISDWSYSHHVPAGPGYYLAGDAAAFVDPILSSGVLLAHQSALSVANAIETEVRCDDIAPEELHRAYAEFYRDLYGGFLKMATWWYHRREVGIDEWLRIARELGQGAIGSLEFSKDDISAFMTFAAGFLTDFRFVNVGCAFGDQGLAETLAGMEQGGVGEALRLELRDRKARLTRRFTRMSVSDYLATDIATSRWWRLPIIHFATDGGTQSYRPPILPERHPEEWVATCLRAIERLLRQCDGRTSIDDAVTRTVESFGPEPRRELRELCNLVLAALSVRGLLAQA